MLKNSHNNYINNNKNDCNKNNSLLLVMVVLVMLVMLVMQLVKWRRQQRRRRLFFSVAVDVSNSKRSSSSNCSSCSSCCRHKSSSSSSSSSSSRFPICVLKLCGVLIRSFVFSRSMGMREGLGGDGVGSGSGLAGGHSNVHSKRAHAKTIGSYSMRNECFLCGPSNSRHNPLLPRLFTKYHLPRII